MLSLPQTSLSVNTVVALAVYHGDVVSWVLSSIESVCNQSYEDFCLVIVIDGQVDRAMLDALLTLAKASEFIVLLQNEANAGLSASMNNVITWSAPYHPRYFVRMDADDVAHPQRLEKQIAFMDANPHVHVLGTALNEINEQGVKVGSRVMPCEHEDIVRLLPRRCSLNHPTVVIRYKLFEEGIRYDDGLDNTQDYFLWVNLVAKGYRLANLNLRLLDFRRVNDFYKRRGFSKSINEFRARLYAMKTLRKFTPFNIFYAFAVLLLRLLPSQVVKLAYKLDRRLMDKFRKH